MLCAVEGHARPVFGLSEELAYLREAHCSRERKAKRELIRVVRSPEGNVSLDFGGKMNGRGAYLCPDPECLKKAIRSKALDRSLEVTIPEEVYARLQKEMEGPHE